MKIGVIIPAAGSGRRMGPGVWKPLLPLGGVPILARAMLPFQRLPEVKEILPVVPERMMDLCLADVVEAFRVTKVKRLAPGGKERQDSVFKGLDLLGEGFDLILIHDGVRPLVSEGFIRNLIAELKGCDAVVPALRVFDTLKEVNPEGWVVRTVDRQNLWLIQTPQVFRPDVLRKAHLSAGAAGRYGTDDGTLVEWIGGKVKAVPGDPSNLKITTPEDLRLAEILIQRRRAPSQEEADRPAGGTDRTGQQTPRRRAGS